MANKNKLNVDQLGSIQAADEAYEVGFKKPPKATRFTKGQSGNPNGRPNGVKNLATIVTAEARRMITVIENGKKRQVMKIEATMAQLQNKAASGDFPSTRLLVQIMPSMESQAAKSGIAVPGDERDRQVLAQLLKRLHSTNPSE